VNRKRFKLKYPLAYIIAVSASGAAMAHGIERFAEEIWDPNPEELESTFETQEIPLIYEYDDNTLIESKGGMTIDVELLAKESGMSYAEAERAIKAQDEFARFADKLMARYPDRIARMWKEPAPSMASHIEFVGNVPDTVMQDVWQGRVPANISVTGGATISFKDQIKRAQVAARALRKSGFVNSASLYNPANDTIELDIKIPEHANRPNPKQILSAIQNELRGTALRDHIRSITGKDIKVKTIRGEGPIMQFDHARGGNWLRDDGFRECTSGWSVSGPNGDGIITAAHCTGLNQFEEEGGLIFDMTWRDQEFGSGGDVEYHTTNHIELDDFYARAGEIRDVSDIRSTWTMFGSSVCEYGRSSNTRTCNHTVTGLFVTVNYSIGTVNNLVRVSGDNSIGGDSGGGWSFNYTAWGVHSGSNGSESFFTPAQQAESILNVTIKR
jgi:hypothetical protein